MMKRIDALINTSVEDARASLECILQRDANEAKSLALQTLDAIPMHSNMTRTAMLRTIVRKADKQLLAE